AHGRALPPGPTQPVSRSELLAANDPRSRYHAPDASHREQRMIGTPEHDAFLSSHRYAVVTTLRADGSPASSVVFYARRGDELFFSTTKDRLKARTLRRDPRIVLTALDEGPPFGYVSVEGLARLQAEDIVDLHVELNRALRRDPAWQPPADFGERLAREGRVIVWVSPRRVAGSVNRG
ncbi:MAG: PPOX class F420-dependent oxidoreductase, partial [Dehalococcoidia bacterium]|nr:PPOX class F420-dependent oxidoreductase [Dehalococcoidia bacterium]